MEVKDFLKGEPISYSLEENLRENLGKQLNIKSLERNDGSFNLIVESAGKEYKVLAVKVNTVKDQWQFTSGDINTFSKKKLVESILRASLPFESRDSITQSILKEKREVAWPIPTAADESYVMLILAISQAKFVLPALNSLAYFDEKDEQTMVDEGLKVIEGKITAEKYAEKFLSLIVKYNGKKLEKSEESIIKSQVEARVGRNKSDIVNPNMKAAAKKSVKKESVLKEDVNSGQPTIGDDLKANFRSYENDADNESDTNTLTFLLMQRHPEMRRDEIYRIAKDWTGYEETIEEGVERNQLEIWKDKLIDAEIVDGKLKYDDMTITNNGDGTYEIENPAATIDPKASLQRVEEILELREEDEESRELRRGEIEESAENSPILTVDEENFLADIGSDVNTEGLSQAQLMIAAGLESKGYLRFTDAGHMSFLNKTDKAKQYFGEN